MSERMKKRPKITEEERIRRRRASFRSGIRKLARLNDSETRKLAAEAQARTQATPQQSKSPEGKSEG